MRRIKVRRNLCRHLGRLDFGDLAGLDAADQFDAPGEYMFVDHALTGMERGLLGTIQVEGPADPKLYSDPNSKRVKQRTAER